jgi:hypothetical protein
MQEFFLSKNQPKSAVFDLRHPLLPDESVEIGLWEGG